MARERKKPEGSFIGRAKNEIENEDTLLTNRAYELGRIRGAAEQKEIDIEKACEWLCKTCEIGICPEERKCHRYKGFRKAMEK